MSEVALSAPRASARTKRLTLVTCILGSAIVFLDSTVVNVALPAIQRDLGASLAAQQWVVEGYLVTLTSLLLVGGSLDDLFDRRTVFIAGVAGFGVFSLLCAIAPSVGVLIAARALQGAAGALLVPSTLAIIMSTFGEQERGGAIGSWTAWTGIATVIGPLGGGALIETSSWRLIFVLNVPLVLVTIALATRTLAHNRPAQPGTGVDFSGAALCALGLAGVVFSAVEEPRLGAAHPAVLATGIAGLAALGGFVLQERRSRAPMLPLGLFRSHNFSAANAATLTTYAGLGGALFFLSLFLQQVAGYSALAAGAAFLPVTALMFALSRGVGRIADRVGPRWFMTAGPLIAGGGLALLTLVGGRAPYPSEVLPALIVFGLGLSLTVAPLTATVLGAVDREHSGVASGVNNATARVASVLAIAILGAFVAGRFTGSLDRQLAPVHLSPPAAAAVARARARPLSTAPRTALQNDERARVERAFTRASGSAFHLGMGLAAALVLAGGLVSAAFVENPRRRVRAADCAGGAVCGASRDLGGRRAARQREPALDV